MHEVSNPICGSLYPNCDLLHIYAFGLSYLIYDKLKYLLTLEVPFKIVADHFLIYFYLSETISSTFYANYLL